MPKIVSYLDLIPMAAAIAVTMCFTVEMPRSDDWDLVPILKEMHDGTLDFKTLDTPYAGHKMDVSYLVMGSIAWLTHWNTWVFRAANLLLLAAGWLAIRPLALRSGRLLEASIFYWSWNQWAAWLWTWIIACSMAICCVLWSLRLLTSNRYRDFALAMALTVIGSFCHGAGLAIWPAAIYLVYFAPRPLLQRVIFGLVLASPVALFLHRPAVSEGMMRGAHYLHMPLFFLFAAGAPVGFAAMGTAAAAALAGLLMLVLGKPSFEAAKDRPFTVGLLLAGLGMIGLLVISRGGEDSLILGMDSRYGTMSALLWVALVLLVDWRGWRRYALILFAACCVIRSVTRIPSLITLRQSEERGRPALLGFTPDRFLLKGNQTPPAEFDADIKLMRQWHYSLFGSE